jgi:hypothetical protein
MTGERTNSYGGSRVSYAVRAVNHGPGSAALVLLVRLHVARLYGFPPISSHFVLRYHRSCAVCHYPDHCKDAISSNGVCDEIGVYHFC